MSKPKAIIVVGLGFGDEGKGTIVDYITRKYAIEMVIKFTGGPQASHTVFTSDMTEIPFSHFGSGTCVKGVETHLSRQMLIMPQTIITEEAFLRAQKIVSNGYQLLSIDPNCCIVTPYHLMLGRMLELFRRNKSYGSVGMGVGQAAYDREKDPDNCLRMQDCFDKNVLREKLALIRINKLQAAETLLEENRKKILAACKLFSSFRPLDQFEMIIAEYLNFANIKSYPVSYLSDEEQLNILARGNKSVIFEGSQGALIDKNYGFWPYVTKTDVTTSSARVILKRIPNEFETIKIGVLGAYMLRHGPGPFVSEEPLLKKYLPEGICIVKNPFQGKIRLGWLDLVATRYALAINSDINYLALTKVDRISEFDSFKVCLSYEYVGNNTNLLDKYFVWNLTTAKRIRITKLKIVGNNRQDELSELLFDCRPLDYIEFNGTGKKIIGLSLDQMPTHIINFIKFLESDNGLGVPIKTISIGPTAENKISF